MKDPFQTVAPEVLNFWATSFKQNVLPEVDILIGDDLKTGYGLSRNEYNSVKNLITTSNTSTIASSSKVFFMPGASTTQNRLRGLCKSMDFVMTNDSDKATVIVYNDNAFKEVRFSPEDIVSYHIGFEEIKEYVTQVNGYTYSRHTVRKTETWRDESTVADYAFVASPLMLKLAFDHSNGLLFMSEKEFVDLCVNVIQPIDEEMLETLAQLILSSDDDNNKLAAELLVNIDHSKNKHLLWSLYNRTGSRMSWLDNRNKDYKAWLKDSGVESYDIKAETMIKRLYNQGSLTSESFEFLEKIARKEISIHNRDMYLFEVKLNPTWQQVLKELKQNQESSDA